MDNPKTDRRVRYTKMVIKQSLLELMRARPINKITVTDICELADVNRGTFYAHYSDPYDLLSQIENELFEKISQYLVNSLKAVDVSGLLMEICGAIKENGDLCKVLFSDYGDKEFLRRILYLAREESIAEWEKFSPGTGRDTMELLFTFMANGSIGIIEGWLQDDMRQSPKEIASFINKVSFSGMQAFLNSGN